MKTISLKRTIAALLLSTAPLAVRAAGPDLKIGDHAPALQNGKWVQGEAVSEFKSGTPYIVEFWATWCGPCKVSIPHLNEVYQKFKDKGLVVIGQDCWEKDESLVEPFVKKMGEKMTYRVALDDKSGSEKGKMAETWMEAAGQNGIPSAFLVDTHGVIAWIGHPMALKEEVIEEILADKYDLKKAAAEFEKAHAAQAAVQAIMKAVNKKDWDGAFEKLASASSTLPKEQVEAFRMTILLSKGDYGAVYDLAETTYHKPSGGKPDPSSAMMLNSIAWKMATDKSVSAADLAKGETMARWGDAAAEGKDPAIKDTLARLLFRQDKKAEAITVQEAAVALAGDNLKGELEKTLTSYKAGELPGQ